MRSDTKLSKNMDTAQIIRELEVDESRIEKIIRGAKDFAPEYNIEQIQNALK